MKEFNIGDNVLVKGVIEEVRFCKKGKEYKIRFQNTDWTDVIVVKETEVKDVIA